MLGKLIKHEFVAIYKKLLFFYGILLALAFSFTVYNNIKYGKAFFENGTQRMISIMLVILFYSMVFLFTLIEFLRRFNKNILGNQGYLMFSIPVKSHQLILSKLIIFLIFSLIECLCSVLFFFIINNFDLVSVDATNQFELIEPLVLLMFTTTFTILSVYLCAAFSNMFKINKAVIGFVVYFAIQIIYSIFSNIFMNIDQSYRNYISIFCLVLFSSLEFWAINFILTKKLNLE